MDEITELLNGVDAPQPIPRHLKQQLHRVLAEEVRAQTGRRTSTWGHRWLAAAAAILALGSVSVFRVLLLAPPDVTFQGTESRLGLAVPYSDGTLVYGASNGAPTYHPQSSWSDAYQAGSSRGIEQLFGPMPVCPPTNSHVGEESVGPTKEPSPGRVSLSIEKAAVELGPVRPDQIHVVTELTKARPVQTFNVWLAELGRDQSGDPAGCDRLSKLGNLVTTRSGVGRLDASVAVLPAGTLIQIIVTRQGFEAGTGYVSKPIPLVQS